MIHIILLIVKNWILDDFQKHTIKPIIISVNIKPCSRFLSLLLLLLVLFLVLFFPQSKVLENLHISVNFSFFFAFKVWQTRRIQIKHVDPTNSCSKIKSASPSAAKKSRIGKMQHIIATAAKKDHKCKSYWSIDYCLQTDQRATERTAGRTVEHTDI